MLLVFYILLLSCAVFSLFQNSCIFIMTGALVKLVLFHFAFFFFFFLLLLFFKAEYTSVLCTEYYLHM